MTKFPKNENDFQIINSLELFFILIILFNNYMILMNQCHY